MAKAKKLGAQQVMFWELLQKVREPKGLSWEPQATGLLLGSSLVYTGTFLITAQLYHTLHNLI